MPQPNEVRIVPSAPVSASAYIYVYATTGLQSATSVPVASTTYWYVYTGTTSDSTLPAVRTRCRSTEPPTWPSTTPQE